MGISIKRSMHLMLTLTAAAAFAACSSDSGNGGGSGGSGGGAGGSSAKGGSGGSASGGAGGSGGSSAKGGSSGSGGSSSGSSSNALFDFASDEQGWVFNIYQATDDSGAAKSPFNLAVASNIPEGSKAPTIGHDSGIGDPPGSLKVEVTFTKYDEQVNPNYSWGKSPQDWTDKTINVRIKVDPLPDPALSTGGIQLFAQDSTWEGEYKWNNMPTDTDWHTYTFNLKDVTTKMKTNDIVQFTVQISSGGAAASGEDLAPASLTAYIDTVTVE